MTLAEEVERCFRENPHLVSKSLKEIAQFFMIQGELRYSLLRDTLENKANFFYCRLASTAPIYAEKCLKEWNEAVKAGEPKKALEEVKSE